MDKTTSTLPTDVLREELKSLDTLETWGASLFLGAIALVSKQIIDWGQATGPNLLGLLHVPIYLLPAVMGLFAFLFLRVVNFRIRRTRNKLYEKAELGARPRFSFGILGWLMALMPLLLGFGASWYFTINRPEVEAPFWILVQLGMAIVVVSMVVFICCSQLSRGRQD